MVVEHSESRAFKPRARLLRLLGDELIRDPNIAIFELVKNAYDADASHAFVLMVDVGDHDSGYIFIRDDGTGMDWDTLTVYGWNLERISESVREVMRGNARPDSAVYRWERREWDGLRLEN